MQTNNRMIDGRAGAAGILAICACLLASCADSRPSRTNGAGGDERAAAPSTASGEGVTEAAIEIGAGVGVGVGFEEDAAVEPTRAQLVAAIETDGAVDVAAVERELERIREDLLIDRWFQSLYSDGVSEADIERHYRQNAERFTRESVKLAHILLRVPPSASAEVRAVAMTRAREAASRLRTGEPFEVVAAELSEDETSAADGGVLGWVAEGEIDPAVMAAAASLSPGEVSPPVVTDYGIHVLKVLEPLREQLRPLAEVRAQIIRTLRAELRREALERLALVD